MIQPLCGRPRLEDGEVYLGHDPDGLVIRRADPVAAISLLLLRSLAGDPVPGVELALARPGEDPLRCCTYLGAVLKISGGGRSVVYRIAGCQPGAGVLVAEWPD